MTLSSNLSVRLSVQLVDLQCIFDLTWGEGQKLSATVPFSHELEQRYEVWVEAYNAFYNSLPLIEDSIEQDSALRSRVDAQGSFQPHVDWQAELVQAEVDFLYHFQYWLRHRNLFDIRSQLAKFAHDLSGKSTEKSIDIYVSATPLSIAKLPWEYWDVGIEFGQSKPFRIARCPHQVPIQAVRSSAPKRKKLRILAILGDETGLDFQGDREALKTMSPYAEIQFVGWQPNSAAQSLKQKICQAIESPLGWDILFFAGHSNEKPLTGGEFAIAPNQVLSLQQIVPSLQTACQNGLKLAVFNSCRGMGIAERLLEKGLCQVVIMREPIHNQVAHVFLQRFVSYLLEERDAQDSLYEACQDLKKSLGTTYPSAYYLPSLFRLPTIQPFSFKRKSVLDFIQYLFPKKLEVIALLGIAFISLMPTVQEHFLGARLWSQAVYRDLTGQLPEPQQPPITIIQVDEESLNSAQVKERNPIDRTYFEKIIQTLRSQQAKIIAINYIFHTFEPQQSSQLLSQSIRAAVQEQKTWFVFSSNKIPSQSEQIVHPDIADPVWSLSGDNSYYWGHVALPYSMESCLEWCPLAYVLRLVAKASTLNSDYLSDAPSITNKTDLKTDLLTITQDPRHERLKFSHELDITKFSKKFGQLWFAPIIDYSVPQKLVYQIFSAAELLSESFNMSFSDSIVLIGSGRYSEVNDKYIYPVPISQRYWQKRKISLSQSNNIGKNNNYFSDTEVQAFILNSLSGNAVTPIPDIVMIAIMAVLSKILLYYSLYNHHIFHRKAWVKVTFISIFYISTILQVYISYAVLIPCVFPWITIIFYFYKLEGRHAVSS